MAVEGVERAGEVFINKPGHGRLLSSVRYTGRFTRMRPRIVSNNSRWDEAIGAINNTLYTLMHV